MAKPLTTTSYAILGLLRLRSWTSYELAKQVQKSLGWFWPRAERKLYDEPKNLVALGLATAEPCRPLLRRWLHATTCPIVAITPSSSLSDRSHASRLSRVWVGCNSRST